MSDEDRTTEGPPTTQGALGQDVPAERDAPAADAADTGAAADAPATEAAQ